MDGGSGIDQDSAVAQATALRNRTVGPIELLDAVIERCERISARLNPVAVRLYERAREAAERAERDLARGEGGPLCGVPVTIKDSQWLAGVPCANGSHTLSSFVPSESSAAVDRLERAGAVIFAKTTCPEFSLTGVTHSEIYGLTSNPWNAARTCGGSSGGAAVAVATGLGPLSLGGDGGGSIRIPAAFCGVVGFKPSFGLVEREPCFPSWKTLVAYGPIARSVADARLMLGSIAPTGWRVGPRRAGRRNPLKGRRIIVSPTLGFAPLDPDVEECFFALVTRLEEAGARLIFDEPGLPSSVHTWGTIASHDAWRHAHSGSVPAESVGEIARAMFEFGAGISASEFNAAQLNRHAISARYDAMFERNRTDILVTPTLGCEAFHHGSIHPPSIGGKPITPPWLDWAGFLYDANLAGLPACALPMGLGDEGLPLSVQVTGRRGADPSVLDTAQAIEELVDWRHPYAATDDAATAAISA